MDHEKTGSIKISLKAKSGYKSTVEGKISPNQWFAINAILENQSEVYVLSDNNGLPAQVYFKKEVGNEEKEILNRQKVVGENRNNYILRDVPLDIQFQNSPKQTLNEKEDSSVSD